MTFRARVGRGEGKSDPPSIRHYPAWDGTKKLNAHIRGRPVGQRSMQLQDVSASVAPMMDRSEKLGLTGVTRRSCALGVQLYAK